MFRVSLNGNSSAGQNGETSVAQGGAALPGFKGRNTSPTGLAGVSIPHASVPVIKPGRDSLRSSAGSTEAEKRKIYSDHFLIPTFHDDE